MAKDPAFLFYPGDWMGGVSTFTRAHKGAYMDLLMAQHNNGRLSIEDIKIVLGLDFETMWKSKLQSKFKQDDNGLYFNKKLEEVTDKRRKFSESRRANLDSKKSHMELHMDSHMENENRDEDLIKKRELIFKKEVDNFNNYPSYLLKEFFEYWSERNPTGKKMRFEIEKTWELKRRLERWSANSKLKTPQAQKKKNSPEVERMISENYKDTKYIPKPK